MSVAEQHVREQIRHQVRDHVLAMGAPSQAASEIADLALHAAEEGIRRVFAIAETARDEATQIAVLGPAWSLLRFLAEVRLDQLKAAAAEHKMQSSTRTFTVDP